ncbi:hypothetical protein FB45DRAFT_749505 [Roridomyces roridus]|uniref:DUF6589 domain-containing protein n=1 Tax=Roridomyces roridus TaxID=1738132 RepID=A0AAD7FLS5_9AGAR|nr:hypothetical protein FB45DRAFT_749505 [Roridomyces roridus]
MSHLQARFPPVSASPSPVSSHGNLDSPRSYVHAHERLENVLKCIQDNYKKKGGLGAFLEALFDDPKESRDTSQLHIDLLSSFLNGQNNFRAVHLVQAMYDHRYSYPKSTSTAVDERADMFAGDCDPRSFRYTSPGLSAWAAQLVGERCAWEVRQLGFKDKENPEFAVHLQASANARTKEKRQLVNEDNILSFSIERTASIFQKRAKLAWYITECLAAPRDKQVVVLRKRRPHPTIQAVMISACAMSQNQSANAYLAMPMGMWLFSCKAHNHVKRLLCRIGLASSDTTVRRALISLGNSRIRQLAASTAEALAHRRPYSRKIIDNIQQYQPVHEAGIGHSSRLEAGTAGTAAILEDFAENAFDYDAYNERVMKNERSTLTVAGLYADLNFEHFDRVFPLHILRVLCTHIPTLNPLLPQITQRFRAAPIAIFRARPGKRTRIVPLRCNGYKEMEMQGMREALRDFSVQAGDTSEAVAAARVVQLFGGDGGSLLCAWRVQRHLLPQSGILNIHETFQNLIGTSGPFHNRMNMESTMAENHFGPKTTTDPSALSRCANAAGLHIPSNLSSCDFYPTERTMDTIFDAQVLDLWDMELTGHQGLQSLVTHFTKLADEKALPTVDELLSSAVTLVKKFASRTAYNIGLNESLLTRCTDPTFPRGIDFPAPPSASPPSGAGAQGHVESEGFTGDRVLANSILFRHDYLFWLEITDAISEGDVGRMIEVLKVWIFAFAGASKSNYTTILVNMYCFFRYEATKDLREAVWNNWLINLTGELGKYIEDDLLQEHHNLGIEVMVSKHGGSFDNAFFRDTISPNVDFFYQVKEAMERGFSLKHHGGAHTSPHIKAELLTLTRMFREEQMHCFRKGRSLGHAAKDLIDAGVVKLDLGKLQEVQSAAADRADILRALQRSTPFSSAPSPDSPTPSDSSEDDESDESGSDESADDVQESARKPMISHIASNARPGSSVAENPETETPSEGSLLRKKLPREE